MSPGASVFACYLSRFDRENGDMTGEARAQLRRICLCLDGQAHLHGCGAIIVRVDVDALNGEAEPLCIAQQPRCPVHRVCHGEVERKRA